ncbi:uncharacterized protein LOC113211399 [Frankliniella occidentalis]|uniref:Uncharacterized protein LOC113211399 n=1 Tax=Frankliniella occidentalis TaxID=133901 RepID=A0A6J1SWA4_FRAOC|nr:uncharacterized protein LOC113211399 [Frankliniella occidentalis]
MNEHQVCWNQIVRLISDDMSRTLVICSVMVAMVAVLALAAPADNGKWTREPGSPTERKTIKDGIGQQIDFTHNVITGQRTSGYLALGQNARMSPERRQGQPSTGGQPSTSEKKKKRGKGK